jgi:hypothetical protein
MEPGAKDAERDAAVNALVVAAAAPLELANQPGRFRTGTKVGAGVAVLSVATAVVASGGTAVLAIIAASLAIVWTGGRGAKDLMVPAARGRRSSAQALDVYFKGVQRNRWDTAFAALAPFAREQVVTTPFIEELQTDEQTMRRSSPAALKEYWHGMACTEFSMTRQIERYTVTPIQKDHRMHRSRIEMWIKYQSLRSFGPSYYRTAFDVTTVKHKSQWWVLDGEFRPPIRVAGAPRAQLPVARVVSMKD